MEKAYMLINTKQGKLRITSSKLKEFDEVKEIHEVYGRFDIVAEVETKNRTELKAFIQNKVQITEGIRNTEILVVSDIEEEVEEEEEKK
ncbi:Lrp/AsnC ligand binding domain-containing protein [Candidatus Woesearchaeota archaeon]|nr:Lrp/AsnC ligand binding domain-containing protein [Candidatus Woesearchaeota archaeon]